MNEKKSRFRLGSSRLRRSFEKEERETPDLLYPRSDLGRFNSIFA